MPQKPPAKAPRGIWRCSQNAAKVSGEGAARHLKPGYCSQNAAKACGKGAARDLEAGYCLTSLSEATRKALEKRPECRKSLRRRRRRAVEARLLPPECSKSLWQGRREGFGGRLLPNVAFWSRLEKLLESAQNAAKASGEGAARQLKPGYCPQNGAKACGKGAARDLEAGYCLTSLSEATRKALGKRPECRKSLRRRRRGAVEARLLPPGLQLPRGAFAGGFCGILGAFQELF